MKNLKLILKYFGVLLLILSIAIACKKKEETKSQEDINVETVESSDESNSSTTTDASVSEHNTDADADREAAKETVAKTVTEKVDALEANVEEIEVVEFVTFFNVEKVPVYPGCEGASDQKACFNKKIAAFVSHNFDKDIAKEIGETEASDSKLVVNFIIDKNGNVTQVKALGPNDAMKKEAERVVNKLPKFEPGTVNDQPVNVQYALPIDYKVK